MPKHRRSSLRRIALVVTWVSAAVVFAGPTALPAVAACGGVSGTGRAPVPREGISELSFVLDEAADSSISDLGV